MRNKLKRYFGMGFSNSENRNSKLEKRFCFTFKGRGGRVAH